MFALQGRRKSEILTLKWRNINFDLKLYTLENTKNGEEQTFMLPDTLEYLLLNMKSYILEFFYYPLLDKFLQQNNN